MQQGRVICIRINEERLKILWRRSLKCYWREEDEKVKDFGTSRYNVFKWYQNDTLQG